MIARLLDPILSLGGWEAYCLVGALVFAEASILIGFIFPGETAVILGGVVAYRGHVNIVLLTVIVVACAIGGDSVGYVVGQQFGHRLMKLGPLRTRRAIIGRVEDQLNRRGWIAVFLARFTAFLRAIVPGLAGMSDMSYRTFLPANALGGAVWGIGYCALGYSIGNAYQTLEHDSSLASDILLALIAVLVVIRWLRRRHRERADMAMDSEAPPSPGASGFEH